MTTDLFNDFQRQTWINATQKMGKAQLLKLLNDSSRVLIAYKNILQDASINEWPSFEWTVECQVRHQLLIAQMMQSDRDVVRQKLLDTCEEYVAVRKQIAKKLKNG